MALLEVDPDVPLYYEVHGEGPTLVLVNGLSQSTANWMVHVRAFARDRRVVTFDWRGQGRTPVGVRPLTPEVFTADVSALLDHVAAPTVDLCGFSYGARIALSYAANHPQRVRRLVLTGLGARTDAVGRTIVRSWRRVLETGGLEAMAWCSLTHIFGPTFVAAHEDLQPGMVKATVRRNRVDAVARAIDALRLFADPLAESRRVLAPSLIVVGEHDALVSRESAAELAEAAARGRLEVVADSGHTVVIERADAWRTLVAGFLA